MYKMRQYKWIGIVIISLLLGGGVGYKFSQLHQQESRLDEINKLIKTHYLEVNEENTGEVQDRIVKGLVFGLNDPYAEFFTAEEYAKYEKELDADYVGIGASISGSEMGMVIVEVYEDSPAKKAGLGKGDIILEVNGESTLGKLTSEVVANIVGEEGTNVELTYMKNGLKETVLITRAKFGKTVYYDILENNMGYLKISSFGVVTDSQVEESLVYFESKGVKDITIDLRGNTGGDLDTAVNILDMFISNGQIVVTVESKKGVREFESTDRKKYEFNQGFILVDHNSASASEIMCSGLMEQLDYTVVGSKTYGKGIAQGLFTLQDGSFVKFTTGEWLSSKGQSIHNVGIFPDIEVVEESLQVMYESENDNGFTPLNLGDASSNVGYLQTMLSQLGYMDDEHNNYFDEPTKSALMQFEQDKGLVINGTYELEDYQVLVSCFNYEVVQNAPDLMMYKVFELIK